MDSRPRDPPASAASADAGITSIQQAKKDQRYMLSTVSFCPAPNTQPPQIAATGVTMMMLNRES